MGKSIKGMNYYSTSRFSTFVLAEYHCNLINLKLEVYSICFNLCNEFVLNDSIIRQSCINIYGLFILTNANKLLTLQRHLLLLIHQLVKYVYIIKDYIISGKYLMLYPCSSVANIPFQTNFEK